MKFEERAEKLALNIHKLQSPGTFHVEWNKIGLEVIAMIATEMRTAVEESFKLHSDHERWRCMSCQEEGRLEEREACAKIAENSRVQDPINIAAKIRSRGEK